ncbi:hypothetical protein PC129_g3192 [Phytophthora cactorum]|uniref:Uncharacterized protein n=2 Tax=Phytophthora cactorum TaxID=29920 RepID=A0A329SNL7_9STRA|nr:hypothetical protein Pcac1_g5571 [Phytophthora cactorum]KAG2836190.1 hypothetical protein PC112_g5383 [Phytophthora cactorum]KAG2839517.1 hypothetical protein PC111_g3837 [Phytophthora cactorum]KAG2863899.1 hypothetical protein PC113_g5039 [Phytophthora cactorum]KAG2921775.1 hypothetical protein PC114_g5548 [Phytophthora cactorum]
MDELQSVGIGVALGLVVVSILALYPGEPFDYSTDRGDADKRDSLSPTRSSDDPTRMNPSSESESQPQIADIERAAQRVKIQKLQELLGLEKEKAQQLVERAKAQAMDAAKTPGRLASSSYTTTSKSAWLDRSFFVIMFGLLVWVLWQDYSINVFSIAAHMLPREAEIIRQVAAAPRGLVSQLLELW